VHVDEDLAQANRLVFAGAQIDLVAADDRLLGIALAAFGQFFAVAADDFLDDHLLDDLLGDDWPFPAACRGRTSSASSSSSTSAEAKRLRQLRAVAVKRIGLDAQRMRQFIGRQRFGDRGRCSAC
jgi:hypothetical protein